MQLYSEAFDTYVLVESEESDWDHNYIHSKNINVIIMIVYF